MEPLGENLAFEELGLVQFHEFVRIARVAILAAEFAAAIRVNGPDEAHHRIRVPADEAARFELEVFNALFLLKHSARCREFRDADELRWWVVFEQHRTGFIFAFCSPIVKRASLPDSRHCLALCSLDAKPVRPHASFMNLLHRILCSSNAWRKTVETHSIPWVLEDLDLGANVLEVGPGPGVTTEFLHSRFERLTCV